MLPPALLFGLRMGGHGPFYGQRHAEERTLWRPVGSGRPDPAKRLSGLSGFGGSGLRGGDGLLWAAVPKAQGAGGLEGPATLTVGQAAWVLRSLSPVASSQPALPVHTLLGAWTRLRSSPQAPVNREPCPP